MRCIELTRAEDEKMFLLFIGETGLRVEDRTLSKVGVENYKKQLARVQSYTSKSFEDDKDIVRFTAKLRGKTIIRPFPPTPKIREDIVATSGRLIEKDRMKIDETTSIFVCETIEEIYKKIEESDEREYRKQYQIMKEYFK